MSYRKLASWRSFTTGLVVLGLVLAACGGDDSKSASSDLAKIAPPEQQVLRLRLTGEPKTIDPHLTNFAAETTLTKPLFSGLFTYDENLNVVADLASALPSPDNGGISKDGLTYTIKIDADAKWSDGSQLTANDFVYSLKRALDPELAGPYTSFYYGIVGAREFNRAFGTKDEPKSPSAAELASMREQIGVEAKDATTIVYRLTEPNPSFLNALALWSAFPVRQDVIEHHGSEWTEAGNHIGNGAFFLKEWAHDQRIVFAPNPFCHGEKPHLRQITIQFIADDAAAYAAYIAGEIDSVVVPPANRREVATPGSSLNTELIRLPELKTFAMIMNHEAAPFDNLKVRQALGMAINRAAFVEGGLPGGIQPVVGWIPPGMPGYDAEIGRQYEFNPTKAREILAEAGYADGEGLPKITFLAVANDSNRLVGQFIEDQIKTNLGVDVSYDYVDGKTFGQRFVTGQTQVTIIRWSADWPYPDNWLPDILSTDGRNNFANYSNSKFDELVREAAVETDEGKRLALYEEAHKIAIDEAALMPLYNSEAFILVKPHVKNLVITGLDGAIKGDYNFHKAFIAAN